MGGVGMLGITRTSPRAASEGGLGYMPGVVGLYAAWRKVFLPPIVFEGRILESFEKTDVGGQVEFQPSC